MKVSGKVGELQEDHAEANRQELIDVASNVERRCGQQVARVGAGDADCSAHHTGQHNNKPTSKGHFQHG